MNSASVLFVSSDAKLISMVRRVVSSMGHELRVAGSLEDASKVIAGDCVDVLLVQTDARDGRMKRRLARGVVFSSSPPVVAVANQGGIEDAVRFVRAGAGDYVAIGSRKTEEVRRALWRAVEGALKRAARRQGSGRASGFERFITADYRMRSVCDVLASVAASPTTLLLEGESGTGKTLLARLVHEQSPRRMGPFVEVNCGALTESLLETELFGHVRGAFTSAYRQRQGKFEVADGGTLLLDEIGSASLGMQARLLRVVESGHFERVGDTNTLSTDVRLIAATKSGLEESVAAGSFREDLYHRLNSLKVSVLPLRERVEDIPLLARHFLRMFAGKHKRKVTDFAPEAMSMMVHYAWPGNARELRNVVERGVILAREGRVTPDSLPRHVAEARSAVSRRRRFFLTTLREAMREPERRCLLEALRIAGWNKQFAAQALGISRSTLYKKIREHGLDQLERGMEELAVSPAAMS